MRTESHNGRFVLPRLLAFVVLGAIITAASRQLKADTGTCGGQMITLPFTDVPASNIFFCAIAEAYFSALTNGTTATTYSPASLVPREQMAAFMTRTLDQSLKRGSMRAALKKFWTPTSADGLGLTTVGAFPQLVESDRADLWVAHTNSDLVARVRASDGKLLETWTEAMSARGVLVAKGMLFVAGGLDPGALYSIDPTQPQGPVATLSSSLGAFPVGITFDGARIWTSNAGGSISIVTLNPFSVENVTEGFLAPNGILFDGTNVWIIDQSGSPGRLLKLDAHGAIIQTVSVGQSPIIWSARPLRRC